MEAPFQPLAVANRFLELANESQKEITLLKLLKLVYYAHGWHLGLTGGQPLLDEQVEAWKFGPVSPSVYHSFKDFGANPITRLGREILHKDGKFFWNVVTLDCSQSVSEFLKKIWDVYGKLTPFQLSELTHRADTPWHKVWYEMGGQTRKGTDIPDNLITEYFQQKKAAQNG